MISMPKEEEGPQLGEPAPYFERYFLKSGRRKHKWECWTVFISHPGDLMPFLKIKTVNYVLCKRKIKVVALAERFCCDLLSGGNFLEKYMLKHNFLFIDDKENILSSSYGLGACSGEEGPVKGLFVIDPNGILRMKIYSPLQTTRNFPEILSIIGSFQKTAIRQKTAGEESRRETPIATSDRTFLTGDGFQEV